MNFVKTYHHDGNEKMNCRNEKYASKIFWIQSINFVTLIISPKCIDNDLIFENFTVKLFKYAYQIPIIWTEDL